MTSVKFCVALAAAACIGVFIGAPAASADPAGSYGPAVSKDTGPGGIIRSCVRTQAAGQLPGDQLDVAECPRPRLRG